MRLAVFTSQVPWGTSEAFVLTEIEALRERVQRVVVVPVRPAGTAFHGELARRVARDALRLPLFNGRIVIGALAETCHQPWAVLRVVAQVLVHSRSWRIRLKNLAVLPKAVYLAGVLSRLGITHVHAHWASTPATMGLVAARLAGIPWSFSAHRWDIGENNLLTIKVRSATFARAISDRGAREILRILDRPAWPSVVTLHMGTAVGPGLTAKAGPGHPVFTFASIGNLYEVKGHRYLVDACRRLDQRGYAFQCHVIGGGPLARTLRTQVEDAGLAARVVLRGALPHDEVMRILDGGEIDAVVHPSVVTATGEQEGIPVALMEAMARGIPVIGTATGGIPELLGQGAGILVEPEDSEALAEAMASLIRDPIRRQIVGEAGWRRVSAEFDLSVVADRLVALMHGDVRGPAPGEGARSAGLASEVRDAEGG
jgi:glycosyltransferase involved in cell wall biosynthesis